jgi:hypothetical protein
MKPLAWILAFAASAGPACSSPPPGTIAIADGELIPHSAVRCDADIRADEGRCLRQEQGRLRSLLHRRIVRRAAQDQGIRISETELRSAIPQLDPEDRRRGAEVSRALAEAVIAVKDGEQFEAVYDQKLSAFGYPASSFEHAVQSWSREDAVGQLAENTVRTMELQTLETARGRLEWQALSRLAETRASARGTTSEQELASMFDAAGKNLKIRIIDDRYDVLNAKGQLR